MKLSIKKGAVDQSVYVFIQDSTSTVGAGKTGLAHDSGSLVCYYVRPLAAAAQLALVTQTVTGAHADGGFVEVSSGNMPGLYRLDLSDAILASGVNSVVIMLKGAAGMAPVVLEIELVAYDPQDAAGLGLSRLDAAVGDIPSAAAIADAVWDETMADHVTAGTTGEKQSSGAAAAGGGTISMPIFVPEGGKGGWTAEDKAAFKASLDKILAIVKKLGALSLAEKADVQDLNASMEEGKKAAARAAEHGVQIRKTLESVMKSDATCQEKIKNIETSIVSLYSIHESIKLPKIFESWKAEVKAALLSIVDLIEAGANNEALDLIEKRLKVIETIAVAGADTKTLEGLAHEEDDHD